MAKIFRTPPLRPKGYASANWDGLGVEGLRHRVVNGQRYIRGVGYITDSDQPDFVKHPVSVVPGTSARVETYKRPKIDEVRRADGSVRLHVRAQYDKRKAGKPVRTGVVFSGGRYEQPVDAATSGQVVGGGGWRTSRSGRVTNASSVHRSVKGSVRTVSRTARPEVIRAGR
jgi:hypothetical protein